ncbi:DUF4345 family protein [Ferrimonas marina]|uniref:DUF4345 domain-containing protein n=1 Tax=Ferrimonas marina TaxID=299255 RepID=A0A1M5RDA2_9GAMM|nr:DUF4345 family protein [Ferrimonas marina]SHH23773.1 protein of unknown function [Ferrimonas marina]
MAKLLVYLTALFFVVYGALFIVLPADMALWVTGSAPAASSASIDFRATYGGAQLAIGVVFLLVVKLRNDVDLALLIVGLVLLLMALGRTVGILMDGQPNALMWVYLIAELVFGTLALYLRPATASK